jgi:hypothetical protein
MPDRMQIEPRSFFRAAFVYGGLTAEAYTKAFAAAVADGLIATDAVTPAEEHAKWQLHHWRIGRYTDADYRRRSRDLPPSH